MYVREQNKTDRQTPNKTYGDVVDRGHVPSSGRTPPLGRRPLLELGLEGLLERWLPRL